MNNIFTKYANAAIDYCDIQQCDHVEIVSGCPSCEAYRYALELSHKASKACRKKNFGGTQDTTTLIGIILILIAILGAIAIVLI